jgi:hypothetical protein
MPIGAAFPISRIGMEYLSMTSTTRRIVPSWLMSLFYVKSLSERLSAVDALGDVETASALGREIKLREGARYHVVDFIARHIMRRARTWLWTRMLPDRAP